MRADAELVALFEEFFEREVSVELVDVVERSGEFPEELWAKALTIEIPWIGIDERSGGVGGTVADTAALLQVACRYSNTIWLLPSWRAPVGLPATDP
jgi:alkylation response protein AidB-like acyl-CoA dehydrogenase